MRSMLLVGLAGLAYPFGAGALVVSEAPRFIDGIIHPTLNPIHLFAMVAVGVFAGISDGNARWAYPASSLGATSLGGMFSFFWPNAEPMAAVSALFLGLGAWSLVSRSPTIIVCSAIMLLGAAHGYQHAAGILDYGGLKFGAGLLLAMGMLQGTGLLLGFALGPLQTRGTVAVASVSFPPEPICIDRMNLLPEPRACGTSPSTGSRDPVATSHCLGARRV